MLPRSTGGLDICKLIPADAALKALVGQYGCLPASKALLSAKIAELASTPADPTKPGSKSTTPGWAQILAYATPEIIAECLCTGAGAAQIPYYPTPRPTQWFENPLVVGGTILGLVFLTLTLTKKERT